MPGQQKLGDLQSNIQFVPLEKVAAREVLVCLLVFWGKSHFSELLLLGAKVADTTNMRLLKFPIFRLVVTIKLAFYQRKLYASVATSI